MQHDVESLRLRELHLVLILGAHSSLNGALLARGALKEFTFESERFVLRSHQAGGQSGEALTELLLTHPDEVTVPEVDVQLVHQLLRHVGRALAVLAVPRRRAAPDVPHFDELLSSLGAVGVKYAIRVSLKQAVCHLEVLKVRPELFTLGGSRDQVTAAQVLLE